MGLFGVPVRMESKLKVVVCVAEEECFVYAGSSLMELVAGDGIQAEVACVGRILCNSLSRLYVSRFRATNLMETMTLSSLPWSRLAALSHASSTSPETSPGSTVWKSTRTSSGSTLLTSILLVAGIEDGLSAPSRRGVPGVLGLLVEVGVPGTGARANLGFTVLLVRDSEEIAALYLCVDARILGMCVRANLASMSEIELLEEIEELEMGRLGVKGTGLVGLLPAGLFDTAMAFEQVASFVFNNARATFGMNHLIVTRFPSRQVHMCQFSSFIFSSITGYVIFIPAGGHCQKASATFHTHKVDQIGLWLRKQSRLKFKEASWLNS